MATEVHVIRDRPVPIFPHGVGMPEPSNLEHWAAVLLRGASWQKDRPVNGPTGDARHHGEGPQDIGAGEGMVDSGPLGGPLAEELRKGAIRLRITVLHGVVLDEEEEKN